MGVMSKGPHGSSERPLPPSTAERDSDILSVDDSDIVFSLGQKYLTEYYQVSPSSTPTQDSPPNQPTPTPGHHSPSPPHSPTTSNPSTTTDVSDSTGDPTSQSYGHVVRLMSLYSELKDSPSQLEDRYSTLKLAADELSGSIGQLRALSVSFGASDESSQSKLSGGRGGNSKETKKTGGGNKPKTKRKT